jgi:hypothetical protein
LFEKRLGNRTERFLEQKVDLTRLVKSTRACGVMAAAGNAAVSQHRADYGVHYTTLFPHREFDVLLLPKPAIPTTNCS